jgi:hypothetical protein
LTAAARNEAPKVSRYEATTRGELTALQNAGQVIVAVFRNAAASGTRTISDR